MFSLMTYQIIQYCNWEKNMVLLEIVAYLDSCKYDSVHFFKNLSWYDSVTFPSSEFCWLYHLQ